MSSQPRRSILPQTAPTVRSTITSTARTRSSLATRVSTQAPVTTSNITRARSTLSTSTSTRARSTLSSAATARVAQATSTPVVATGVGRATRGSIRASVSQATRTSPFQVASRKRTPTTESASVRSPFAPTQEDTKASRPCRLCGDFCNCHSPVPKLDFNLLDSQSMVNVYYCPICYTNVIEEDQKLKVTKCGHVFCEHCITTSLLKHTFCPICSTNVTKRQLLNVFL